MHNNKGGFDDGQENGLLTTRNITIRIVDTVIPLRIKRSEIEEAAMRKAANKINKLYSEYNRLYPDKEPYEYMMFVALHIATTHEQTVLEAEEIKLEQRLQDLVDRLDELP